MDARRWGELFEDGYRDATEGNFCRGEEFGNPMDQDAYYDGWSEGLSDRKRKEATYR